MTKQITTFSPNTTGIAANNVISSATEIVNLQNTQTAVNNTGEVVAENRELLEGIYRQDTVIAVDSTKFTGGTNELAIVADAITYWDQSVYTADKTADATITGWGSKTITGLTSSNTFYIWATFVSGSKDYEATNVTASLPSNITEKALVGIATVAGGGAVTFTAYTPGPVASRSHYFRDIQYFLNGFEVKGVSKFEGLDLNYTSQTSDYTLLVTDNYVELGSGAAADRTFTLPAAASKAGQTYTVRNRTTLYKMTLDGNSSETIDGLTTYIIIPGGSAIIYSDGNNWQIATVYNPAFLRLCAGNGHGSTNTMIRRFSVTTEDFSNGVFTYADSATNGATITINQNGIYSISYVDQRVTTDAAFYNGISKNSAQLTTSIQTITNADRLAIGGVPTTAVGISRAVYCPAVYTGRLLVGDVIRPHTNSSPNATVAEQTTFTISRVA